MLLSKAILDGFFREVSYNLPNFIFVLGKKDTQHALVMVMSKRKNRVQKKRIEMVVTCMEGELKYKP
jgi:hypothetical protein